MPTTTAASPGFVGWVLQYGQIVLFFAQMIYWAGILLFAGYAVAIYKRYTNFQMGMGSFAKDAEEPVAAKKSGKVKVDDFVE